MKKPPPQRRPAAFSAARFDDALLRRIAATADHGAEAERHHAALRRIVREQNGLIDGNSQAYYPADALELCALGQAECRQTHKPARSPCRRCGGSISPNATSCRPACKKRSMPPTAPRMKTG